MVSPITICQNECAVTSTIIAMMNIIDIARMHPRRPIRSAIRGAMMEPMILPAVGTPLPVIAVRLF